MENLFIGIQNRIATNMAALSLVDEDYGQLETEDDIYPVTFPCVLIGSPITQWADSKPSEQRGECNVTLKLAIDCYDDTHYTSGTQEAITERAALCSTIVNLLHNYSIGPEYGPLQRTMSRSYSASNGIKIYEETFKVKVTASLEEI